VTDYKHLYEYNCKLCKKHVQLKSTLPLETYPVLCPLCQPGGKFKLQNKVLQTSEIVIDLGTGLTVKYIEEKKHDTR
jgi:hypothetical protein